MQKQLTLIILIGIFCAGCSSGPGINPPTTPLANIETASSLPIIAPSVANGAMDAIGVMGMYELWIDFENANADLAAKRSSSHGEAFIVSGTPFFTMTPCADCLKLKSISLDLNGNIVLGMSVKHPFEKGDSLKPPSAMNRLDLDVFDLALMVVPKDTIPDTYSLLGTDAYPGILANASGYSRELSNVIDDSSAIPYRICYEDANNNRFKMGTDYQPFDLVFSSISCTFDLYLTMGYGASATKSERLNPKYHVPEFNRKSAWKVDVTPPNGNNPPDITNTWNDSDSTTLFDVNIDIYDWNHGATVAALYPDMANLDYILSLTDIESVSVEVPGMAASIVSATTSDTSTNGWDDPISYTASFANENNLPAGMYHGLVKVKDTRVPGTSITGGETDTLVHTEDSIALQWFELDEFAAYQTFIATVVIGCGPITGSITDPNCPVTGVTNGQSIQFTAAASSANGGDPVVLYEWDMDYDGVTFDVDATGSVATLGPFNNPNCGTPPEDPVTYTVAVRGTDSCSQPNVTVFDTCDVTVDDCSLVGVGNVTLVVNRTHFSTRYPVDNGILPAEIGPYTLSWSAPAYSVAEYAIYTDHDPTDGLTNDLSEIGTTTSTSYNCPGSEIPSTHFVPGYTYIVRARTVAGNPSSESLDSQPAHVIVTGFETLPVYTTLDGEGWKANCEGTGTSRYYRPFVTGANRAHGVRAVQFSRRVGDPSEAGLWNGMIYGPTPSVPDSSVRFLTYSCDWRNVRDGGIVIGTCSSQPTLGWTDPQDEFEASNSSTLYGLYGYTQYHAGICTYFNGCPVSGNNCWQINQTNFMWTKAGGDCNEWGDPTDDYIGIECLRTSIPSGDNYSNFFLDDVAIAIY
jgi:hypothetical protein